MLRLGGLGSGQLVGEGACLVGGICWPAFLVLLGRQKDKEIKRDGPIYLPKGHVAFSVDKKPPKILAK